MRPIAPTYFATAARASLFRRGSVPQVFTGMKWLLSCDNWDAVTAIPAIQTGESSQAGLARHMTCLATRLESLPVGVDDHDSVVAESDHR